MSQSKTVKASGLQSVSTALYAASAGMMEALICHPLDTIKVEMQGSTVTKRGATAAMANSGVVQLAGMNQVHHHYSEGPLVQSIRSIYQQSPLAFYRGLGAVMMGIMPKMAIRFTSFEIYKSALTRKGESTPSSGRLFVAGLAAGITEAVLVVTPTEVIKIRLQTGNAAYRSAPEALVSIARTEGVRTLWSGVGLTAARQGTNQAANFLAYSTIRQKLLDAQPQYQASGLPAWQTALNGFLAGSLGPLANAPLDTLKTRIQKKSRTTGTKSNGLQHLQLLVKIAQTEGWMALYKGILPRVLRVGVGQSVTFMTYELLRKIEM